MAHSKKTLVLLPREFSSSNSGLLDIRHEEDAITWLWAYPHLMPWKRKVVWLYTPVVGNAKWPGDLWGLDSAGNLLILECKQCKRNSDPFEDFVRYHRRSRPELTSDHWRTKFKRHLRAELRFDNGFQERPSGRTDGLLPRSNKRSHLRRWPELAAKIDKIIRSSWYPARVYSYLQARARAHDPTPYYFALMSLSDTAISILTDKAIRSASRLQNRIGKDHVGVAVITGKVIKNKRLRLEAMLRSDLISTKKGRRFDKARNNKK